MGKKSYDVIVIGAGMGGSSCAALLAKRGLKVLLVEKNDRAGGKALSLSKKGFAFTAWVVVAAPILDNKFEEVLREIGMEDRVNLISGVKSDSIYISPSGEYKRLPYMEPGALDPEIIFDWLELKGEERDTAMNILTEISIMPPEDIDKLNDISFDEWILSRNPPRPLYAFIVSLMCDLMFMTSVDAVVAAEAVFGLQNLFLKSGGLFCEGGYGALAEVYCDAVRENGSRVIMKAKTEKITIENGQVTGIVTDKGAFKAPVVISNAGIQPTVLKLVGEEHFSNSYTNYVKDLLPSNGMIGMRYYLDKKVIESGYGVIFSDDTPWNMERFIKAKNNTIPRKGVIFFEVPDMYDPKAAPEGKQIVMTGYWCPADPNMTKTEKKKWIDMGEETMLKAFPEIADHIESKEMYSSTQVSRLTRDQVLPGQGGECIGLGQVLGQCWKDKPSVKAPIQGLFYVGCDAGGTGVGTQQAVDSGIKVTNQVLRYHRMHAASP